jgi:tRNA A-37 threonylcarbamoyl transferase component Bud32
MPESKTCPNCGGELPENAPSGICPKCLMGAGLDSADESKAADNAFDVTTPHTGGFVPPNPAALAPHFPHLEISELLGHGGMGAVYKARQTKLDRQVALKIIRPEAADDPSFAERFNREARTLARLSHPNIVAVHDFGEVTLSKTEGDDSATRTLYYFLMEYVDGASLRQLLKGGELASEQALAIVPQICEALQFAHDESIVHRDIKPENILVDRRGRVKIADFGLAKLVSDDIADYTLTGTHQVMGTPRYMAPEQMEGARDVDHRADIYSLGVVLYEMLTGELPLGRFDLPSRKATLDKKWDEVVLRALEKEPQKRYQHASEVKLEIESISDLERPPVQSDKQIHATEAVARSNQPTIPHLGMIAMAVLMVATGLTLVLRKEAEQTHLFLLVGMLIALSGGACAVVAFGLRIPRRNRVNGARLMQGAIMVFMGFALLLFCYMQEGGWFVGNPGIWLGIGLTLGGGGFFIGSWSLRTGKAETADDLAYEYGENDLHEAQTSHSKETDPREMTAQLLRGPSIGLIVAGAINCLCMLPWAVLAYYGMMGNRRIIGGAEEEVMIWLFSSAVSGILILFASLKMRQLEAYRLSLFGAIVAILPLTPGALFGVPMGLWALALLTRKDVRREFRSHNDEIGK